MAVSVAGATAARDRGTRSRWPASRSAARARPSARRRRAARVGSRSTVADAWRWRPRSRRAASRRRWRRRPSSAPAPGVDQRPAGVAGPHQPAQRGQQARDRPLAVGVLGDHVLGPPDAARLHVEGPVLRVAEDRPGGARRRVAARGPGRAGRGPGRAARRGRRGGRRRSRSAGRPGGWPPTSTSCRSSPATTCAFVTTRSGAGDPAGALDRQPAGGADDPHHARAAAPHRRAHARSRGSGAATPGEGPVIEGSGSRRASAPRIGPDGGSSSFSSRRIAERWMSARSWSCPDAWAATAAAIHTIPRPTPRRGPRRAAPSSTPRPGIISARRSLKPKPSRPVASIAPAEQRAEQAEGGRVRRGRALGQQQRPEAGAEEGAEQRSRRTTAPRR